MFLPACVGDYTDFYASCITRRTLGRMMRPDSPLLPNYRHLPIGYHGRASSLVISGTPVRRPWARRNRRRRRTGVRPDRRLDYELEVGVFIGRATASATLFRLTPSTATFSVCAS